MTRIKPAILITTVLLLLMVSPASAQLQKGDLLPELSAETISGEDFSLDRLKGGPFILKIGTTWCGTCSAQAKTINGMRDYLKEKNILFIDVFIRESANRIEQYFNDKDYQSPDRVLLDDGKIARQLNIYVIPRILLIDKDHRVYRDGADLSGSELKQELERMLAEN